jgi:xanthine dehydrogenase/oxidase
METQTSIVVPGAEDEEFVVYSSTQNPSEAQELVASILGIPQNRVKCKVGRLGGGFGGKESRSNLLLCALSVAAQKTMCPVRCQLDRDEDIKMSGQRHPFLAKYKVAATKDGWLRAVDVKLYSNGGHSMDLSMGVLERAVSHLDNCYYFPNARIQGKVCRTNTPSNTAFRGFGGPQGMFICETIMDHLSCTLGIEPDELRYKNLYSFSGQITPFHTTLHDCSVRKLWDRIVQKTNLKGRNDEIREVNRANKYLKRGISIVPTKFGIAFGAKHLNQAGCLVHLLRDGSVQVAHGGIEMGQGIHTKMTAIVADALGVPFDDVHIITTNTTHVSNTSPSAASATSDLNGGALLNACCILNERLKPVKELLGSNTTFKEIVNKAYLQRVDLSARGFYATPGIGYNWETGEGNLFNYFTYGVAVSEVEVDTLTGQSRTLFSSIIMDLGTPINIAIDIGQIEGAFMQGLGLFTMEELWWLSSTKNMFTVGPGTYKIPTISDCPKEFQVEIYSDNPNPRAINSSRAVGEPPLFLASSVFFAIKEAIKAANRDSGYFRLDSPATCARIRLAINDDIVQRFKSTASNGDTVPWSFQI